MFKEEGRWEILAPLEIKLYQPDQIVVGQSAYTKPEEYPRSTADEINRAWEELLSKNPNIKNNSGFTGLEEYETRDGLRLFIKPTDYKHFLTTHVYRGDNSLQFFEKQLRANLLGEYSSVETIDGKILISKRSEKLTSYRGYFSSFGRAFINHEKALAGQGRFLAEDIKDAVAGELKTDRDLLEVDGLEALIQNGRYQDFVLLWKLFLKETSEKVLERRSKIIEGSNGKYEDIHTKRKEELGGFLKEYRDRIPETITPAWVMHGAHEFGESWVDNLGFVQRV